MEFFWGEAEVRFYKYFTFSVFLSFFLGLFAFCISPDTVWLVWSSAGAVENQEGLNWSECS